MTTENSGPIAMGSCVQCKATGLPIMPVRYTAVPDGIKPALPGWASGEQVTSVDLGPDFHYALRTLREGFVYLFYEQHARGNKYWECYAVYQDGSLSLQPFPLAARKPDTPDLRCGRQAHNRAAVHYLVIEQPEKCGATWMAFSQDPWSEETLNEYTVNSGLRDARMQTLHPAQMVEGAEHRHGSTGLVGHPGGRARIFGHGRHAPAAVRAAKHARHRRRGQRQQGGRRELRPATPGADEYPLPVGVAPRPGRSRGGAHEGSRQKKGRPARNAAGVLALWDAIGITHELNGYRNDAAGWIKKYGDERALQITALNAIEGAKQALESQAARLSDQRIADVRSLPDPLDALRTRAETMLRQNPGDVAARQELADIQARRASQAARGATDAAEFKRSNIAKAWPKYEARLSPSFRQFKLHWDGFLAAADALIDRRTAGLIRWLEAPLFLATLEDFHKNCTADGALFEDAVGDAIFGLGSCKAGQKKIDEWVAEATASARGNLLWRAIAMNQQEGVAEVDAALAHIYGSAVPMTSQSWADVSAQIKWNKIFDLGKKSLTVFNTQMKALNDPASGIKPLRETRGLEKIFLTVGGSWLKPFTGAVDLTNTLALRTMLLVRSGATVHAARTLGALDAASTSADREMLIRRLQNQSHYVDIAASADYEHKASQWAALRSNVEVPDARRGTFNAVRDSRLSLIVAVFEAYNLHKTSAQAAKDPGNETVQAALTAAKLATSAAAVDVIGTWVKGLAAAGDRAVGFQALKLGGGALSVLASGYGVLLDFAVEERNRKGAEYQLATFYGIRGAFQATSAVLSSLTALSYCSPLIEAFGKKFGERWLGQTITNVAARLLAARAALLLASIEVSIFLLAVSCIIWYFDDDALQKWCDRCAFGAKRAGLSDAYRDADLQQNAFAKALLGIE